jgi:hypothetical protein
LIFLHFGTYEHRNNGLGKQQKKNLLLDTSSPKNPPSYPLIGEIDHRGLPEKVLYLDVRVIAELNIEQGDVPIEIAGPQIGFDLI